MLQLYVDGSWMDGEVGYGAVLVLHNPSADQVLQEWHGHVPEPHTEGTRQVAGELFAVGVALRWCREQRLQDVHVYYDYEGIGAWAEGRWKAKLSLTQRYRDFVAEIRSTGMRLHWHKVAAHTGVKWNDRADALAKAGAQAGLAKRRG
jgi:ribonuclease HI